MKIDIQDGVLKQVIAEEGDQELVIPEGVTTIAADLNYNDAAMKIPFILPKSLCSIKHVFHNTVAFDGEYENVTLVLYGTPVDLSAIFHAHTYSDPTDAGTDYLENHGWTQGDDLDKHKIYDASWEYYNEREPIIIQGLINELNLLLSGFCEKLEYLPANQAFSILDCMLQDVPEDASQRSSLETAREAAHRMCFCADSWKKASLIGYIGTRTHLEIPSNFQWIGEKAFAGCTALEEVVLPESIQGIHNRAFLNCTSLKTVTIHGAEPIISGSAFLGCANLTNAPDYILAMDRCPLAEGTIETECGKFVYQEPGVLEAWYESKDTRTSVLTIPPGTYQINAQLGSKCTQELNYPDSAETLGKIDFYSNKTLQKCKLPKLLSAVPQAFFRGSIVLTEVNLSDYITTIEENAFSRCTALASIHMPESLHYIEDAAFNECSSLKTVCLPANLESIGNYAFNECAKLETVQLPDHLKAIGLRAFFGCKQFREIIIPNSVTSCGEETFQSCSKIEKATVGCGLTAIVPSMFAACSALQTVILPHGITSIDAKGFQKCRKLKEITFPDTLTAIGVSAFENCLALETITLVEPLKTIGKKALNGCTALRMICLGTKRIAVSCPEDAVDALLGKEVKQQECPDNVCQIENGVLTAYVSDESHVIIPDEISAIGKDAFVKCSQLETLQIGLGITEISAEVLQISSLTAITVANNHSAFMSRDGVLFSKDGKRLIAYPQAKPGFDYTVPNGTETLGKWSFANSQNLVHLTMPKGIDKMMVEDNTFFNSASIQIMQFEYPGVFSSENWWILGRASTVGYVFKGCKVKTLQYTGAYGEFEVPCSAGKMLEKQVMVQRGFDLLTKHEYNAFFETDPWRSSIDANCMLPLLAAFFATSQDSTAIPFVTENLAKLMPKRIAAGDSAFVKAVLHADMLDSAMLKKYTQAAKKAGQTEIQKLFEQATAAM